MENIQQNNSILNSIREYVFGILDEFSSINIHTNINRFYRIEKNINTIIEAENATDLDYSSLLLAYYIITIEQSKHTLTAFDPEKIIVQLNETAVQVQLQFKIENQLIQKAKEIAIQTLPTKITQLKESQIISDAMVMDFASDKGRDRIKSMYEQMIIRNVEISKTNWYEIIIPIIESYTTYTIYAQENVKPLIEKLIKNLKKEKKALEESKDILLQKELNISDEEIKQLKKELSKVKDRDDRGIQTIFKTTSKNHYTLNRMVDGKAKIMITINSIILSLVLGGIIKKNHVNFYETIPAIVLTVANFISILFAIISIMPNKTQGNFTEEEIRSKKGNLLYFGNFHNMHYRDFEWAFIQILQDRDYLYTSLIRDFYYQAQILHKKNRAIRVSLFSFLIGSGISVIIHFVLSLLL